MISKKNIMICSLLITGAHAYAMDQDRVKLVLTRSQAETIKKEVGKHYVMQFGKNNLETNKVFNNQRTQVQSSEMFDSRLAWFNAVVDSYVKKNQ